jgi:autotransporter-associated beta strand protein
MSLTFWTKRKRPSSNGRARAARPERYRPTLEVLEDRLAPATHIWVGPTVGGYWSDAANWSGGVPTSGEAGGTILQFNGNVDCRDNIAGLVVDQIHFTAGGAVLRGVAGPLGINGANLVVNMLNDAGTNVLDNTLPLVLSGADCGVQVTAGAVFANDTISGNQNISELHGSTGALVLAGSNSFAGNTVINAGTLLLTGDSPAYTGTLNLIGTGTGPVTGTVNGDYSGSPVKLGVATLGGEGTVQSINTVGKGGVISPGDPSVPKTLHTAAGAFASVLNGATFQVKVNDAAGADQLIIGNGATVDLTGATLSVNVLGSAPGNVYTIVSSATGGINGTFNGLADGATFAAGGRTFRIHYTANAVTLTDSPPPPSVSVASGPQGLVTEEVFANGDLVQVSSTGSIYVGPNVRSAAIAFNPVTGEAVLEVVSLNGTLTQYDRSGIHVMAPGVRSVALAFNPSGAASLYVVSLDGTLTLYDATGVHTVGSFVQEVSLAFSPSGKPVMEVVSFDGTLTQYDATGVHPMGSNALATALAFSPNGEAILEVVSQNGQLTQYDAMGVHPLLTNALFASLNFPPSGAVLDVIFQNGALDQFDPSGAHFLTQLF